MRRIIITTLIALTGLAGVASADRPHVRDHRGGVYVAPSHGYHYNRHYPRYDGHRYTSYGYGHHARPYYGYGHHARPYYGYNHSHYVVRPSYRYVRRPIFLPRPTFAVRYYNYYQQPALIAERYGAMPGYFWVPGRWSWNGYEWIWMPGHYEPDPSYSGYYSNTYDPTYYQQNPYYDPSYIY